MNISTVKIEPILEAAKHAASLIMAVYHEENIDITAKNDASPLTRADLLSHHYICEKLNALYPDIPILSEEHAERVSFDKRSDWGRFFLVDPLDGTKEFIARNGEFSINIALIEDSKPILGLIYIPTTNIAYYAIRHQGAFKFENGQSIALSPSFKSDRLRVLVSRSHRCQKTDDYLQALSDAGYSVDIVSVGSALKFAWIAEGKADLYPRFSPTMEWDTAAGQVLVEEVGKCVKIAGTSELLSYNTPSLVNPSFIVES